jgi:hypothetical protein
VRVSATRFNDAVNALLALYRAAPALAGVPVYHDCGSDP